MNPLPRGAGCREVPGVAELHAQADGPPVPAASALSALSARSRAPEACVPAVGLAAPSRPVGNRARRQVLGGLARGLARAAALAGPAWCLPAPARAQAGAAAGPDAQALLVACDAIRNPAQPFRMLVTLTEFEKGNQVGVTTLVSHARKMGGAGQYASILRFQQPQRDAGKVILRQGSDMWFYDPSSRATIRISPQQRLTGQAANGDVVTVNFASDYSATLAGEEDTTDGDRRKRRTWRLKLAAASDDATYGSIDLWIDQANQAPVKARFFADSGRALKTAYYRRFQSQLGAERPTEMVIIDALEAGSVTVMRLTDFAWRNLPTTLFHKDQLQHFTAE